MSGLGQGAPSPRCDAPSSTTMALVVSGHLRCSTTRDNSQQWLARDSVDRNEELFGVKLDTRGSLRSGTH